METNDVVSALEHSGIVMAFWLVFSLFEIVSSAISQQLQKFSSLVCATFRLSLSFSLMTKNDVKLGNSLLLVKGIMNRRMIT